MPTEEAAVGMPEIRRYRLMPVAFDARHHALEIPKPEWDPEIREQAEENRKALLERLAFIHGEANLDVVARNMSDLGSDPWSSQGWHLSLWQEVRHAFVSGAYYPAAVGAGALGERVLNHLLFDLADDCGTAKQKTEIEADKAPMFYRSLEILQSWNVLEPEAASLFEQLRVTRNGLTHYSDGLYEELRDRSLAAVGLLRDALDAQFGVLVQRRLIPNTPGFMFLKQDVEAEPFVRRYMLPMAMHVSPRHEIEFDVSTGFWRVKSEHPVEASSSTDAEFVRLMSESGR